MKLKEPRPSELVIPLPCLWIIPCPQCNEPLRDTLVIVQGDVQLYHECPRCNKNYWFYHCRWWQGILWLLCPLFVIFLLWTIACTIIIAFGGR
jgi:hypothetical protein